MTNLFVIDKLFDPPGVGEAYRYKEKPVYRAGHYNPEYDDPVYHYSHMVVVEYVYPIIKFTPKGFWILYAGEKKFVLKSGTKRFAWLDKIEALQSFLRRKEVHASYATKRLARVEQSITVAKKMLATMLKEKETTDAPSE